MDNKKNIEEFLQSADSDFLLSEQTIGSAKTFLNDAKLVIIRLIKMVDSSDDFCKKKSVYTTLAMRNAFIDKFKFALED